MVIAIRLIYNEMLYCLINTMTVLSVNLRTTDKLFHLRPLSLPLLSSHESSRHDLFYSTDAAQYLPGVQWSKLKLTIHLHVCRTSRATTNETRYLPLYLPSMFYGLSIRSEGLYKLLTEPA
jgi:hypothetical protein